MEKIRNKGNRKIKRIVCIILALMIVLSSSMKIFAFPGYKYRIYEDKVLPEYMTLGNTRFYCSIAKVKNLDRKNDEYNDKLYAYCLNRYKDGVEMLR